MNRKGFTLIELLGVIVVLSIVALIAYPRVNSIIKGYEKGSFETSVKSLLEETKKDFTQKQVTDGINRKVYSFPTTELDINADSIKSGIVIIKGDKSTLAITGDKYCAVKSYEDNEASIYVKGDAKCIVTTPEVCFETKDNPSDTSTSIITKYLCGSSHNAKSEIIEQGKHVDVIIPDKINSKQVVGINPGAFSTLDKSSGTKDYSKKVYINSIDFTFAKGLTVIGPNIFNDNVLTSVDFLQDTTEIGENTFENNNLKVVVLPSKLVNIKSSAFINNKILSVVIPDTVREIGDSCFENNEITDLAFNGDTLTYIGNYSFRKNRIEKIKFPKTVSSIKTGAFQNNKITQVELPTSSCLILQNAFDSNLLTNLYITSGIIKLENRAFYNNRLTSVSIARPQSYYTTSSYGSSVWGWAPGYTDSNIKWNVG